ncbi:Uma2 family endonuclease [Zavarzinella formosa]|uniref:Uma2 family endonuclease n=1 Tax=Zavarzinella formosa TaxID=360055 RepID=UPI0002F42AC0|nr:Uma2 family endonuclease [Zavarzinella formosa]
MSVATSSFAKTDWMERMILSLNPGQTVSISDAAWDDYLTLCGTRDGGRPGIKICFANGRLLVVSPSFRHEKWTSRIGAMIELLAEELGLPYEMARGTTFRQEELRAGLEADECFYFANAPAIAARDEIDLERDPPPDLALEVDLTTDSTVKLDIYARIGVPEVWQFDGEALLLRLLQTDGRYAATDRSPTFPMLNPASLVAFLNSVSHLDQGSMKRQAREWIKTLIGGRS